MVNFKLLDGDKNVLFDINTVNGNEELALYNPYFVDISPINYDSVIIEKSTLRGASNPSYFKRMKSRTITITDGAATTTPKRYAEIVSMVEKARFINAVGYFEDGEVDEDGVPIHFNWFAEINISAIGIQWNRGGLLKIGTFTMAIDMLDPLFLDNSPIQPLEQPQMGQLFTHEIQNDSMFDSPFHLRITAEQSVGRLDIRLSGTNAGLIFTDNNFGVAYNILEVDTLKGVVTGIDRFSNRYNLISKLSLDSMFFTLPTGESMLRVIAGSPVTLEVAHVFMQHLL